MMIAVIRRTLALMLFTLAWLAAPVAVADPIIETLPEFNGPDLQATDPYPQPPLVVGTFNFAIPAGDAVVVAVLNGTFGNSLSSITAGLDLFLDGILVAQCIFDDPCWQGPALPWQFAFAPGDLGIFADGSAVLSVVQTSKFTIRLSETS